ncbi:MAG: DNA polymerase III subunit delta [Marinibacterium sp.]|nr:DNA polymerase III subunit delta [Marinibacterium sp.]
MKLSPREAPGYFAKPDPRKSGLLIFGQDPMRVALRRQQVIAALLGPAAAEEMRLTRLAGSEVRSDPALVLDAIKAAGFFPGHRAVFVEDATDACGPAILSVLENWQDGDATLIVTAGALKASSKLRKGFEAHPNAFAAAIYDDPPSRAEIEAQLKSAGLAAVSPDAQSLLSAYAAQLGPGDFSKLVEKIGLYKLGDAAPLSLKDVEACAPQSVEADLDDILNIVAEARSGEIGPTLRRLQAQGTNAVSLCIGATRHFRTLYAAASDPKGAAAGVGKLRPPVFGPRRDRIVRQASTWGPVKLEAALTLLTDTDLQLRSTGQTAPAMALVERALIRLAMLGKPR